MQIEIFKKFLRQVQLTKLMENPIGKFITNLLPQRIQLFMLSGLVAPRLIELNIRGLEFGILTSYEDDHFQSAFLRKLQNWEEKPIKAWINSIENNSTVIDVGAYLGVYSILALRAGAGNVVAYEPNFKTVEKLNANLELNGLHHQTIVREVALSNFTGKSQLLVPNNREISSGAQLVNSNISRDLSNWKTLCTVQTLTLDEDLLHMPIRKISVIKIDTEGFEYEVLLGATKILRKFLPTILVEILENKNLIRIETYLRAFGYNQSEALDGFDIRNQQTRSSNLPRARNYLFIHPSKVIY